MSKALGCWFLADYRKIEITAQRHGVRRILDGVCPRCILIFVTSAVDMQIS